MQFPTECVSSLTRRVRYLAEQPRGISYFHTSSVRSLMSFLLFFFPSPLESAYLEIRIRILTTSTACDSIIFPPAVHVILKRDASSIALRPFKG